MAAAEYFSSAPMHIPTSSPYQQPPTSHSQAATSSPSFNPSRPDMQAQAQAPPPYQEHRPGVHFASTPVPADRPPRHSFSGDQRPSQVPWSHPPQQGYSDPYTQQNMALQPYQQQPYGSSPSNGYGTSPQRPQYLTPHMRPYANPNSSHYSIESGGYASDPEHNRRKHKHRHRKDSGESRSVRPSSRSSNSDAFLGAAGGGLIGDLIFPGLGTVGGAVAGWLGGKDYGHRRQGREEKRHEAQREWEKKFGHRHRSGSRSHHSRESSSHLGVPERYRRHSEY